MTVNSDVFTDTNGTALSTHNASWTIFNSGVYEIQNNECRPRADVNGFARYDGTYGADQYAQSTRPVITPANNKRSGQSVRIQTGVSAYYFQQRDFSTRRILNKMVNGTITELASDNLAVSTTAVYKVEAVGSAIKTYVDGAQLFSVTDTSIASGGGPGFFGRDTEAGGNQHIDNWEGGDIGVAGLFAGGLSLMGVGK